MLKCRPDGRLLCCYTMTAMSLDPTCLHTRHASSMIQGSPAMGSNTRHPRSRIPSCFPPILRSLLFQRLTVKNQNFPKFGFFHQLLIYFKITIFRFLDVSRLHVSKKHLTDPNEIPVYISEMFRI